MEASAPPARATISTERADHALQEAVDSARQNGVDAAAEILPGDDPRRALIDEAARSALLVVASRGDSRAGGIAHQGPIGAEGLRQLEAGR